MSQEEEKYINEFIDKFNNMTYEEQQEELKALYIISKIIYVKIADKYCNAVERLREIQKQFKNVSYIWEEEK